MTPDEFGDPYEKVKLDDLIVYLSTPYSLRTGDVGVMGMPGELSNPIGACL